MKTPTSLGVFYPKIITSSDFLCEEELKSPSFLQEQWTITLDELLNDIYQ